MKTNTRALLFALTLVVAACGRSPVTPAEQHASLAPAYYGGHMYGGGGIVSGELAVDGNDGGTADQTCTEDGRGGHALGGGNYAPGPCPTNPE